MALLTDPCACVALGGGRALGVASVHSHDADWPHFPLAVTVRGLDIIFSIIHLSPMVPNSPFTFTVLAMFFSDTYRYTIW